MNRYSIDTVLAIRVKHQPGHLARLTATIAEQDGLVGEITTLRIGEDHTLREVTIETNDDAHTQRVVEAVRAVPGIELVSVTDRVFECHRGGKIHQVSTLALKN